MSKTIGPELTYDHLLLLVPALGPDLGLSGEEIAEKFNSLVSKELEIEYDDDSIWLFRNITTFKLHDNAKSHNVMDFVNVIVVQDGVVDANYLFVGLYDEIAKAANEKFLELCQERFSNFDEYTSCDILSDGYAEYGRGSVCISWPDSDFKPSKFSLKKIT